MGKNKVSQKTIVAIILIMLMSITLSVSSLAFEWATYPERETRETYTYKCIIYRPDKEGFTQKSTIHLLATQGPMYYKNGTIYSSSGKSVDYYPWYEDTGWGNWMNTMSLQVGKWHEDSRILYSNHDIYSDSTLTDVFFSATRLTPIQKTLTQHPPLTLMSHQIVGIIPYLIGLLIALVAFWKAWQFLFKTLRKA
mgnify:CR=1 FL=1